MINKVKQEVQTKTGINLELEIKLLEMKNKNILVVLGGTSGEREVSLESGRACANALKKKRV